MENNWIGSAEASTIMSEKHKRPISADYVRLLGRKEKIRTKVDEEKAIVLFWRPDIEAYKVARRTDRRVEVRVRDKRSGKPGGRPRKNAQTEAGDAKSNSAA